MAIPSYEKMMTPILNCLNGQGNIDQRKPCSLKELGEYVANFFALSNEERELTLSSKQTVVYSRVSWAKTYLSKAGLVEKVSRGVFKITERGVKALQESKDINNQYLMRYETFADFFKHDKEIASIEDEHLNSKKKLTPVEQIDVAFEALNKELEDEVLEQVKAISPQAFEKLVVDLLLKMGYGALDDNSNAVTKLSHDRGIDGIISADKLGFDKIYIQAKQYNAANKVGRPALQAFVGACISAFKLVFITTSSFTNEALDYAEQVASTKQKLVLIDGAKLSRLMIEFDMGVQTQTQYALKRLDSDFFTNYGN